MRSRVAQITGAERGRGHGREQRVQALRPGVAAAGALLGVAVGLPHGVIDVEVGQLVGAEQQRSPRGQIGQQPGRDRVELPDVAEGERAQERAQRRRRPHPGEQPVHPAVPQQVHVVDGVRAGDHAGDQRGDLRLGVRARRPRQPSDGSPTSRSQARRSANDSTGTRPAHDTRLGSSNRTLTP